MNRGEWRGQGPPTPWAIGLRGLAKKWKIFIGQHPPSAKTSKDRFMRFPELGANGSMSGSRWLFVEPLLGAI